MCSSFGVTVPLPFASKLPYRQGVGCSDCIFEGLLVHGADGTAPRVGAGVVRPQVHPPDDAVVCGSARFRTRRDVQVAERHFVVIVRDAVRGAEIAGGPVCGVVPKRRLIVELGQDHDRGMGSVVRRVRRPAEPVSARETRWRRDSRRSRSSPAGGSFVATSPRRGVRSFSAWRTPSGHCCDPAQSRSRRALVSAAPLVSVEPCRELLTEGCSRVISVSGYAGTAPPSMRTRQGRSRDQSKRTRPRVGACRYLPKPPDYKTRRKASAFPSKALAPFRVSYLSSTLAPASSRSALSFSASSRSMPSLTGCGASSTTALASLRPGRWRRGPP